MASRRKTIVINKKFQYQYSLLGIALTVLAVNLFVIFRMFYPGDNPLLIDTGSILILAAVELILVAGVWYACIKSSFRIAGPVYVFSREIAKLGAGDFSANITLRRKDMFQEEAAAMNVSLSALRSKIQCLKDIGQQLESAGQQGEQTTALLGKLQEELSGLSIGDETQ